MPLWRQVTRGLQVVGRTAADRAQGWEQALDTLFADVRYGVRRLRRSPGFTAISAATLALGIGASTAIFSAVNPILFEPLPYPHAGRVAMIWDTGGDGSRQETTFGTYRELVARARSFEALAVTRPWQPTLTGAATPERLEGQRVTPGYFRALGVSPVLGRDFQQSDDGLEAARVAIISDGLWRRHFAGDPAILGRAITLDEDRHTVIGVMPAAFENVLAPATDVWRPLQYDSSLPPGGREWGHHLRMVGRLTPDVGMTRATQELASIARTPVPEITRPRWASLDRGLIVNALQDDVTRGVRPALLAVLGAVMLLLAIACVNVTNLFLARGVQRRGELAMRAALGAGRSRLIRQMLTESLLLAVLGGALGIVVADAILQALVALSPAAMPRPHAISIAGSALTFAFVTTALVGLVVGLVPALHVSRRDLHVGIERGSARSSSGHRVTRGALVVAEVALAVVLLIGAGLLLRSLQRLFAIDPGFATANLLAMQVQTSGQRFSEASATHRFFASALDAVRQTPGVSAAAFTSQLPLSGDEDIYGVHFESSPTRMTQEERGAFRYAVSPGYFETLGIPLRSGRVLDARDTEDAPRAAVINESFARRRFPGQNPVGQRLHVGPDSGPWFTIVGIVGDVRQVSLESNQRDAIYVTTTQWHSADNALWLVARTRDTPAPYAPALRQAIWSVDKDQPIARVATMDGLLAASAAERRFALLLFEAFGIAALVLAAIGIYGLLSGSVTERLREIGVRSALGASRADILTMVLRHGLTLTGIGVAIGLAGAVAASRALITLLFDVPRLDPLTYAGAMALLLAVSAIASWAPAWRAAWVDPAITLRAD